VTFNTAEFANIAAATAAEVAAVINAEAIGVQATVSAGAVRISTDIQGTDASIENFGGTAATALGFSSDAAGTGDVGDIANVTAAEAKTLIEADITGLTVTAVSGAIQIASDTTGVSSSILVAAASTADTKFGLDNATHSGTTGAAVDTLQVDGKTPGAYANDLQILIEDATSGEAEEFNLSILDDGLVVEGPYANLSMVDTHDSYIEDELNGVSNYIEVTDLDASPTSQRPANGTSSALTGGDDGLTGLVDADFGTSITSKVGLHTLDTVQDVNILIIPGQATSVVQNGMITYCEDFRDGSMFAILDSPEGSSATEVVTYFETTASLVGLSEFGAAYWPWVKVQNPSQVVFGTAENLTVSPAGHIAGIYARTDAARAGGVYDPPAGIEEGQIEGIVGFETDEVLDENKRDFVFPKRINILTTFTGAPRHIDGSRCLKANGNFPFVSQRRGAIFIEQSIKNGVEFARNKLNTTKLRRTVERTIRAFLLVQMKNGAFVSEDPDTAFFVDFSDKLNDEANKIKGRVGLAFNEPAEFIVIRFSRDTRALEQELAS
jgi:phage tail sheath protein FI